jgi:hypothetical protein
MAHHARAGNVQIDQRKRKMTNTFQSCPALTLAAAPARHSKLFLVLLGLAGASLIADVGLLMGAVLIR